jgi:hypothetical protein
LRLLSQARSEDDFTDGSARSAQQDLVIDQFYPSARNIYLENAGFFDQHPLGEQGETKMKSTAKAEAQARVLAEKLTMRLSGSSTIDTVRQTKDANGWPVLVLSDGANEASGQPVVAIRIKDQDAGSKDVFGSALQAFNPQIMECFAQTGVAISEKDMCIIGYEAFRRADVLQSKTTQAGQTVESQLDNAATTLDAELYELR